MPTPIPYANSRRADILIYHVPHYTLSTCHSAQYPTDSQSMFFYKL